MRAGIRDTLRLSQEKRCSLPRHMVPENGRFVFRPRNLSSLLAGIVYRNRELIGKTGAGFGTGREIIRVLTGSRSFAQRKAEKIFAAGILPAPKLPEEIRENGTEGFPESGSLF